MSTSTSNRGWKTLSIGLLVVLVVLITMGQAGDIMEVFIRNFPDIQSVSGDVQVTNLSRPTQTVRLVDQVIPPVSKDRPGEYVELGTIRFDGYSEANLGIAGEVKGFARTGTVGMVLLPQLEITEDAFDQKEQMIFALEVEATYSNETAPYVYSKMEKFDVAFGTYLVYAYNTTGRTVEVDLIGYLSQ